MVERERVVTRVITSIFIKMTVFIDFDNSMHVFHVHTTLSSFDLSTFIKQSMTRSNPISLPGLNGVDVFNDTNVYLAILTAVRSEWPFEIVIEVNNIHLHDIFINCSWQQCDN